MDQAQALTSQEGQSNRGGLFAEEQVHDKRPDEQQNGYDHRDQCGRTQALVARIIRQVIYTSSLAAL